MKLLELIKKYLFNALWKTHFERLRMRREIDKAREENLKLRINPNFHCLRCHKLKEENFKLQMTAGKLLEEKISLESSLIRLATKL